MSTGRGHALLTVSYKDGGRILYKDTQGDIIVNTLEYFRKRTQVDDVSVPKVYRDIKHKLEKTMTEGKRVLLDIKDSYSVQTVVVRFEYVSDRWAMGKSICYTEDGEVEVPYTVHYSDIYCKMIKMKVIVEGENPYDSKS